jgi:hypothetical protein
MDFHDPTLFLTAVSMHGLDSASSFAERRGAREDSDRWRAASNQLRAALASHTDHSEMNNERTLAVGVSPTFTYVDTPEFRAALESRWAATRDEAGSFRTTPLWTYFDLAHARQWLALREPGRAWATLEYFWASSPHPGLYTLWESNFEQNGFDIWPRLRGWMRPPHVTPHYWASGEMIMLQTAMLAAMDRSGGREVIMIGAGVKPDWLAEPMHARGLVTERGRVDWQWSERTMRVMLEHPVEIALGPAFPADARIEISIAVEE